MKKNESSNNIIGTFAVTFKEMVKGFFKPFFTNNGEEKEKYEKQKQESKKIKLEELQYVLDQINKKDEIDKTIAGHDNVVLVMGATGAGKSTLVNYLSGVELSYITAIVNDTNKKYIYNSQDVINLKISKENNPKITEDISITEFNEKNTDNSWNIKSISFQNEKNNVKIGHEIESQTKLPNSWYDGKNNLLYVDCPGFDDTNTKDGIVNAFYIEHLFNVSKNVKLMLVVSHTELTGGKAAGTVKKLINSLDTIIESKNFHEFQNSISLVVTKTPLKYKESSVRNLFEECLKSNELGLKNSPSLKYFCDENSNISCFKNIPSISDEEDITYKTGDLKNLEKKYEKNGGVGFKNISNKLKETEFVSDCGKKTNLLIPNDSEKLINALAFKSAEIIRSSITSLISHAINSVYGKDSYIELQNDKITELSESLSSILKLHKSFKLLSETEIKDPQTYVDEIRKEFEYLREDQEFTKHLDIIQKHVEYFNFYTKVSFDTINKLDINKWPQNFRNVASIIKEEQNKVQIQLSEEIRNESLLIKDIVNSLRLELDEIKDEAKSSELMKKSDYLCSVNEIIKGLKTEQINTPTILVKQEILVKHIGDYDVQRFEKVFNALTVLGDERIKDYLKQWKNALSEKFSEVTMSHIKDINSFSKDMLNKDIAAKFSELLVQCKKQLSSLGVENLQNIIKNLEIFVKTLNNKKQTQEIIDEFINHKDIKQLEIELFNKNITVIESIDHFKTNSVIIEQLKTNTSEKLGCKIDIENYDAFLNKQLITDLNEFLNNIKSSYDQEINNISKNCLFNITSDIVQFEITAKEAFNKIVSKNEEREYFIQSYGEICNMINSKDSLLEVADNIKVKFSQKFNCSNVTSIIENIKKLKNLGKLEESYPEIVEVFDTKCTNLHVTAQEGKEIQLNAIKLKQSIGEISAAIEDLFKFNIIKSASTEKMNELIKFFHGTIAEFSRKIKNDPVEIEWFKSSMKNKFKDCEGYKKLLKSKIDKLEDYEKTEQKIDANCASQSLDQLVTLLNSEAKWFGSLETMFSKLSELAIEGKKYNVATENNFSRWMKVLGLTKEGFQYSSSKADMLNKIMDITIKSKLSCSNDEPSHLQITGDFVKLSDVTKHVTPNTKNLKILCKNTLVVDCNLTMPSANMIVIAPKWQICGNKTISLKGLDGKAHLISEAAGKNSGFFWWRKAEDGLPGNPGENGGHFYGYGLEFKDLEKLTIDTSGGRGGKGQNGGDGANGSKGKDANGITDSDCYQIIKIKEKGVTGWIRGKDTPNEKSYPNDDFEYHTIKIYRGWPGHEGHDGGKGGLGGNGGVAGSIMIKQGQILLDEGFTKIQDSKKGFDGKGGLGGKGGKEGYHEQEWFGRSKTDPGCTEIYGREPEYYYHKSCMERAKNGDTPVSKNSIGIIAAQKPLSCAESLQNAKNSFTIMVRNEFEKSEKFGIVQMIKYEKLKTLAEKMNLFGNGIENYDEVNQFSYNNFFDKYYGEGIDKILSLRVETVLKGNNDQIKTLPAKYALIDNPFCYANSDIKDIDQLVHDVQEILKDKKISTILVPFNLDLKHWIGLIFIFDHQTKELELKYIDSENNKIPEILINKFISKLNDLPEIFADIDIDQLFVNTQTARNCGPELIENMILFLTGSRFKEAETVIKHSELIEKSLKFEGIIDSYVEINSENLLGNEFAKTDDFV